MKEPFITPGRIERNRKNRLTRRRRAIRLIQNKILAVAVIPNLPKITLLEVIKKLFRI